MGKEEEPEPVYGYTIDEEDLIIDNEKFEEEDFLKRWIEYYPTRSKPLGVRHQKKLLQVNKTKTMNIAAFVNNLKLGKHYRKHPLWMDKVRYEVALNSSYLYLIPLNTVRRKSLFTMSRKRRREKQTRKTKPVTLKLWAAKSRQVISVEFFPGDSCVDDICDSVEYVQDHWDCEDITEEHWNIRKREKYMKNVLHICDRCDSPENLDRLLVYNLSRPDNSLTTASGRWRYRFCNIIINVRDRIANTMQILKVRVLDIKWIQTLDPKMKKAITPSREDLKSFMSAPPSNYHGRTCWRCPYIRDLNKIDLRTFPIASLAWFALIHHNFQKGVPKLQFVAVEKVTVQHVSGSIIHIYISAKDHQDEVKVYTTEAFFIGWLKSFKLSPLTEVPSTEVVVPCGREPLDQCCCTPKRRRNPCRSQSLVIDVLDLNMRHFKSQSGLIH